MERLKRFIKAIDYLKTKAEEPTNEGVAKLLRYKALNYISDVIGGSKEINPLLLERMVEFSISTEWIETGKGEMIKRPKSMGNEPAVEYKKPSADYLAGQLAMAERLIAQLKSDHEEAKADKEKLFSVLASAQHTINEVLKPIKEKTDIIETNSVAIRAHLRQIGNMTRADDSEMMDSLDRIEGREVGTSSTEAGIFEHALGAPDSVVDKNPSNDKGGSLGIKKQKRKA